MFYFLLYWITASIQLILRYLDYYMSGTLALLDYYVPGWRVFLLSPFVITFLILPMLLVLYLYFCALLLFVYRRRHSIMDAFHQTAWDGYRQTIAAFWSGHGWIWHGYEVVGLENIPTSGPALLVYYHGAFPIDVYYLLANIYIEKGRIVHNVVDNFVFKIPGLKILFRFWGSMCGPRSEVVEYLKDGALVGIAPGGVREALFSENYSLVWKNRVGFAKAALEAEVPILPVFTENCRQAFDYVKFGKSYFSRIYEKTRWPILPMYGGFPVKLTTYIGKPIKYDPAHTPEILARKVTEAMEAMIVAHQTRPYTVLEGLLARFYSRKTKVHQKSKAISNAAAVNTRIDHTRSTDYDIVGTDAGENIELHHRRK
ncbi:unnamed protein product [Clavelina lepadiformis]|uniref:Phospholipid/glycerol acyltransferase domain-containing protein n=1 Tax=Clavelina lepadiformis TaxID=159417 RepID=A0ABP0GIC4_CLALP